MEPANTNIRILSEEHFKQVQEALIEAGCVWADGSTDILERSNVSYITVDHDKKFRYGSGVLDMNDFPNRGKKEVELRIKYEFVEVQETVEVLGGTYNKVDVQKALSRLKRV